MFFVVTLRGGNKAINPREKTLCTMVSVEDDRYAILFCKSTDVECSRNGTSDGSVVVCIIKVFTCIKLFYLL